MNKVRVEPLANHLVHETLDELGASDKPTLMVVHSHIGYGSPNKANTSKAHGSPLGEEEVVLTKSALGWPHENRTFYVPAEVRARFPGPVDENRSWRSGDARSPALVQILLRGERPPLEELGAHGNHFAAHGRGGYRPDRPAAVGPVRLGRRASPPVIRRGGTARRWRG